MTRLLIQRGLLASWLCAAVAAPTVAAPGGVTRVEHVDPDEPPSRGPKHAPVTLEVFFAPTTNLGGRSPIIRAAENLQSHHPTRIRLVYRVVKRPQFHLLATLALEAQAQGRFAELIAELHNDRASQTVQRDKLLDMARRLEVDPARLDAAITDGRHNDQLAANDRRLSRLLHTDSGTVPAIVFNSLRSSGSTNERDLERDYLVAYERALDMLDRGVPHHRLMDAFDEQAQRRKEPLVLTGDDDDRANSSDHRLVRRALSLRGMPSYGKQSATGAMPVIALCHPRDASCGSTLGTLSKLQQVYANEIRIVFAPWFDVRRDDVADLAMLADAALCAEQVGSSPNDLDESPGWAWVKQQYSALGDRRRNHAEAVIDNVARDLRINTRLLSACRAKTANTSLDWVATARRAGVTRSPAIIIGGRIYEGLNESRVIQQLIDAELAPGILGRCATIGCSSEP